jgi:hypothetical protein
MVVVEGATLAIFVTGTITMLVIGVLLNIVGLGIFCWALFALATHALPFFIGLTVGFYSFQAGAGPFGAIVVGFVTAGFTLVVGQYAFSVARSPIVRCHRCRGRRLGACVDAHRHRSETGRCTQSYSATEWSDDRGRVTMRICRISVGMTLISGRRC